MKYTGIVETERTATGVITREKVIAKDRYTGKNQTRWFLIGYTSFTTNDEGKLRAEGVYGQQLANELAKKYK